MPVVTGLLLLILAALLVTVVPGVLLARPQRSCPPLVVTIRCDASQFVTEIERTIERTAAAAARFGVSMERCTRELERYLQRMPKRP